MDCVSIIAQAALNASSPEAVEGTFAPIDMFWEQITSLNVVESLTFLSFGAVCLLYGWRVFKMLVVINFGLIGLILGMSITSRIVGLDNQIAGGLVGMVLLAALSVPLMRWSVSILGAFAGAIIASGLWYACNLNQEFIWAGALTGVVAGGMISFIVFRVAVILFTSLWGSSLVVIGSLALLYMWSRTTAKVEDLVLVQRWFLPAAIIFPTIIGMVLQHKFVKGSKEWDL